MPGMARTLPLSFPGLHRFLGNHQGAVAIPHAGPAVQQAVSIVQKGIGVKGDGRDLVAAFQCPSIQRLDVLQDVTELEPAAVDAILRQRIEHEGIVRVRTVGYGDQLTRHGEKTLLEDRHPRVHGSFLLNASGSATGRRKSRVS